MSDSQGAQPERTAPPSPRRNAAIAVAGAILMLALVALVGGVVYLMMRAAGAGPQVRVALRALRPTRYEFRIHHVEPDLQQAEARVRRAVVASRLLGPGVRVQAPEPGRLVIESSAADAAAHMEQAALLQRVLESLPYRAEMTTTSIEQISPQDLEDLRTALERRAAELGSRAQVESDATGRFTAQVWGAADAQTVAASLTASARLEFVHVPKEYTPDTERDPATGREEVFFTDRSGKRVPTEQVLAEGRVIAAAADLRENSCVTQDTVNRLPQVAFEFRSEAADRVYEFTRTHKGQYLAIVLDGEVISAPVVRAAIRAKGIIEGGFASAREAQALADLLNAGALPLDVEVESVQERPRRGAARTKSAR